MNAIKTLGGLLVIWRTLNFSIIPSLVVFLSFGGAAQEIGKLERFGENGRLISRQKQVDHTERAYVLSRRSYRSEDSFGYSGNMRIRKEFDQGGFEEIQKEFYVSCFIVDSEERYVRLKDEGASDDGAGSATFENADKRPTRGSLLAYNLYRSMCPPR